MSEVIEELAREAQEAVRGLLRKAYEQGFRDALAGGGQGLPAPVITAPKIAPAPVAWGDDGEMEDDRPADEMDDASGAPDGVLAVRPIAAHATVSTLRDRIVRLFALDRFDIEVFVCRRGDPNRRQLKGSARLRLYRREVG